MHNPADRQPASLDSLLAGGNRAVAGLLAPIDGAAERTGGVAKMALLALGRASRP